MGCRPCCAPRQIGVEGVGSGSGFRSYSFGPREEGELALSVLVGISNVHEVARD